MDSSSSTTRRGLLGAGVIAAGAAAAASAGLAGRALAQAVPGQPADSPATMTARANAGTVGIISGGVDGTYIRIAADLASVLDDGDRLRVLPIIGKGSVRNLADVMYLRGVDIGIVQSDVLAFVRRERMFPGVEQMIQYIAKLYDEEVHVLAGRDVERLRDLAGKPVNVDVQGSGTAMTASLLFGSLGIPVRFTHDVQDVALERLRRGEIAALVYVAGKPARLFSSLDGPGSGLHFLPVEMTPELLATYLPGQLGHAQYPNLVPEGEAGVETIAVGAVMAVYAWRPGTDRYRKVARFVEAFFGRFDEFLRPPRHPKWREVNLAAQVPGWTRFPRAQELRPAAATIGQRG
ncbi:MAG: TRAP transporter substrate-binding protein [Acetobacteraceae bacterium]|nr:TRAP transporter substrate-binding protein [Acetobacteraceae bacterium]